MAKKQPTKAADAAQPEETEPAPRLRRLGDGAAMVSAEDLAELHGQDVLDANAAEAQRIRAQKS